MVVKTRVHHGRQVRIRESWQEILSVNSIKVYKWNTSVTFTVALPPGPPTTLATF